MLSSCNTVYNILRPLHSKDHTNWLMKCSTADGSHIIQNRNIIKTEEYITPGKFYYFLAGNTSLILGQCRKGNQHLFIEKYKDQDGHLRVTSVYKNLIAIAFIYVNLSRTKYKEVASQKSHISETTLCESD